MDQLIVAVNQALEQPERKNWQHIANEWADMATNGIQWVRNISEGISTPEEALKSLESDLAHCREVNDGPVDEESKP
jgi:hypothetical protein